MKKRIISVTLSIILCFALAQLSLAAEKAQAKPKKQEVFVPTVNSAVKEIQGEVSAIVNNFISIIYKKEKGVDYEIGFPIDKNVKLVHKKSLQEIAVGDTVSIEFEEVNETAKDGTITSRKPKAIYFVRPAIKKPAPFEPEPDPEWEPRP